MGRRERTMILERAAAYVLAVVCVFQAVHPSWTIRPQCWRSVDLQMGWLRLQARNGADSVCFEGGAGKKVERACSSEGRIALLPNRPRNLKRLMICMTDSGCMTTWLDGTSYGWSISKDKEDYFDKGLIGLDARETSATVD
jgi:hypothetical protein